jgi:hypothetical protein
MKVLWHPAVYMSVIFLHLRVGTSRFQHQQFIISSIIWQQPVCLWRNMESQMERNTRRRADGSPSEDSVQLFTRGIKPALFILFLKRWWFYGTFFSVHAISACAYIVCISVCVHIWMFLSKYAFIWVWKHVCYLVTFISTRRPGFDARRASMVLWWKNGTGRCFCE